MSRYFGMLTVAGYGVIEFLLNGQFRTESLLGGGTTLLDYLRIHRGLTGTKEGCASGDCGACTVLLGSWQNNQWVYESINSCLLLLGAIHGKQVLTVEALPSNDGLHPAQQAMVDCSGSQCGFCTPGFVMSLAGLYMAAVNDGDNENAAVQIDSVHTAISGNLCRCTGYKPIVAAAQQMPSYPQASQPGQVTPWQPSNCDTGVLGEDASSQAFVPQTEIQLRDLLNRYPQATLVAGGTDANLYITQGFIDPPQLIILTQVKELAQWRVTDAEIQIGAAVSYQQTAKIVAQEFPGAKELLGRIGSLQIRHAATLAGNLANASPIGDGPPLLMALNARIDIATPQGERECSVSEFITGYKQTCLSPGEYIRRIRIPRANSNVNVQCYKVSKRFEDDISTVLLAARIERDGDLIKTCTLAFGGMAAVPKRASAAEKLLLGKSLPTINVRDLQQTLLLSMRQDFAPVTDVRASASYRLHVAANLIVKLLLGLQQQDSSIVSVWSPVRGMGSY